MSDNNNVTEIEEGVIEGTEPIQATSSNQACIKRAATRLSVVSKQYDIDGDGVLDPAELAMRKLDTSGRGFLTNEKVYALMQEQLAMQKSMFQMKKIIAGLLAFVFILALANLGTSFASAILAKDTKTSNGELVDKNTNEAVATASAVNEYAVAKDDGNNARALQAACAGDANTATADCDTSATTTSGVITMPADKAQAMLKDCLNNKNVNLKTTSGNTVTTTMICGPDVCSGSTYTCQGNSGCSGNTKPTAGELCIQGSTSKVTVKAVTGSPNVYSVTYPSDAGTSSEINPAVCPSSAPEPNTLCGTETWANCGYSPYTKCDGSVINTLQCSCVTVDGSLDNQVMCLSMSLMPETCCTVDNDCNTNTGGDFGTTQFFSCFNGVCTP